MTLTRPRQGRLIAGVCAGLARHLGWSASRVRLVYILCSILSVAFPGILVYLALWFLMPNDDA
ncbi:MAG: PspC domain-containing protein [Verrucomicrobia bacterium]|jgi:phage shock protein PspC (stress-responsive transcriptional regulator)|nr:PspC domain-containing protein [Verrucomicrobiota bacterium]